MAGDWIKIEIKAIAFDCFGTLFDTTAIPREDVADYVRHVRKEQFSPYTFPLAWYGLKTHPDSPEGIRLLQAAGFLCVALSNGTKSLIQKIAEQNGITFDRIIDLTSHGVYKPHKLAYLTVQAETGIKPEETLMVTANPTFGDVEGAAAVGMAAQVIRHGYPNTVIELAEKLVGTNG